MPSRNSQGQATVELAVSLLLLTIVFLLLLQVGLVARDQVLVTQAAREGARAAAVDSSPESAAVAAKNATGLSQGRITVQTGPRPDSSGLVTVTVHYRSRVMMPVINQTLLEPLLQGKATMRVETP